MNRAIWALGLRNPFTFAFQPGTGRMFINDVGQNTWEEINDGGAGANYGWPTTEGTDDATRASVSPLYAYGHGAGRAAAAPSPAARSTTRDRAVPAPTTSATTSSRTTAAAGSTSSIRSVRRRRSPFAAPGIISRSTCKVGADGSLYYLARGIGQHDGHRAPSRPTGSQAPGITASRRVRRSSVGQPATFTVAASGTPPLTLSVAAERRATSRARPSSSYTHRRPRLRPTTARVPRGRVQRLRQRHQQRGDAHRDRQPRADRDDRARPPRARCYAGGIDHRVSRAPATDPEDGTLPASAFTWRVDFHHDTHTHPFIAPTRAA